MQKIEDFMNADSLFSKVFKGLEEERITDYQNRMMLAEGWLIVKEKLNL